jgi:pyruvate/2-oxoglutarate dehydrogenase complex dihydrolipoamide dehydrogenase (E3) component
MNAIDQKLYNVAVIGAGTAGLVTAAGTAGLGGRVALIERNKMGGDCLNFGCVPSKALISSARLIEQIRESEKWGLDRQEPQFAFEKVFERMRARRAKIAPNDSQERFESLGVDVFRGEARFVSPHEIEVGGQKLRARNFVIATGSRAAIPEIEGMDQVPYFTNETIFDELAKKPESLTVLGGGPIGCELGQVFARLSVSVTILQRGSQLLPREDSDVAEVLQRQLEREDVRIEFDAEAKSAARQGNSVRLDCLHKDGSGFQLNAEALLIAVGRIPNIDKLNLDVAGVRFNKRGIIVNKYLQTSQPHIYAAGDIAGSFQFTHLADAHARVVVRNILMPLQLLRQKTETSVLPWVTYTDPEIAHVGFGEREARHKNVQYDVFVVPLEEVDRAVVESEEIGFAKILTGKDSDKILGVTIVGARAGDLIHEFVLAMKARIGLGTIASTIHAYPTFAELARKAGDKYNKTRLTPVAKKILSWLYERARK